MRWGLTVAAATLTLAAGPALAGNPMFDQDFPAAVQPALAGHVEIGAGVQHFTQSGGFDWSASNTLFEGAGRVNVPLGGVWNFEAEVTGRDSWNSRASTSTFGAYAHLWTMFPGTAFGVFGGMQSGDLNIPPQNQHVVGPQYFADTYTGGIEGEVYLSRLTLGAQASTSTSQFTESYLPDYHSWQVRGYAAYYLTADTKLVGDVRYTDPPRVDRIPSQSRWDFSGLLEHRFAGTPWSIWASGSYSTSSSDGGYFTLSADSWSALIGFRLFMDAPGTTLYRHDREVPFKYDNQPLLLTELSLG